MIKLIIILFILICALYILNSNIIVEHYEENDQKSASIPLLVVVLISLGLVDIGDK